MRNWKITVSTASHSVTRVVSFNEELKAAPQGWEDVRAPLVSFNEELKDGLLTYKINVVIQCIL